jgi:hypothetical protein
VRRCPPSGATRRDKINVEEALNDELIAEINDWDRAEVKRAAEEYAGSS